MILHGNQRGGAKNLALHLLKEENEHVDVHELRGFASDSLVSALNEIYAVSRGTRAKKFLFSLSLNPPPTENVSTDVFEDAIGRIEQKLGLSDQPRAIIFHSKEGRRHCHAVWSRIDAQNMKAIPLSFTKRKLMNIARELYLEQGWQMPRGLMNSKQRDPKNFTLAQWQQAKRIGRNPREIKRVFQECWAVSDNQSAFQQALKERGYTLARGDRRGFVALDHNCEVFAVSKWVGIRTKAIRSKLTDQTSLPGVDEARAQIAKEMAARLAKLRQQQDTAIRTRIAGIETKRLQMAEKNARHRRVLEEKHQKRWHAETLKRQGHFNKGLHGLFDRITGKYRRIKRLNEQEAYLAGKRDRKEKDALIFKQLEQRQALQVRIERLNKLNETGRQTLKRDISQYNEIADKKRESVKFERYTKRRSPVDRHRLER
ncbi:MAG: relaxase/mobilization nuclease domain-containing protein [Pseudomonadota bacterium]